MAGMKSWSTTAANNVLANTGFTMDEGQAPSTLNDSIRQAMADIRTEWAQGANIASAATVDLSTATGGYVHITGAVTITAFGTVSAGIRRKITFDGALTLTHNATSLILPTGASIVTVAGDTCEAMSEGSGNWRVLWYAGKNVQSTNVIATIGVVTPLVGTDTVAELQFKTNATLRWQLGSANGILYPSVDNVHDLGIATNRIAHVFTPIIDTGTTGPLSLKTNNGTTQFSVAHSATAVNNWEVTGSATGGGPVLRVVGADTDILGSITAKGAAGIGFYSSNLTALQFQVLHTASASRNITVTGSNGGNPTISTTAGSLAITPNIVQAGGISGVGNIATTGSAAWGTGLANFGTITKRKTADESVTSSTVLQDDDHLTFAIAANEEWTAVFKISAGALISNTGLKMAATVPSGATLEVDGTFVGDSAGITLSARTTTSGTAFFTLTGSAGSATVDVFLWVLNGATPGNVTLQWAQQSSSGTALTLRKGSFLQATRVA